MLENLTPDQIAQLLGKLDAMPMTDKVALLDEIEALEHSQMLAGCRASFLKFCERIYPTWKEGPHHRYMEPILHEVRDGTQTRVTVSMPPRFGKALALDTEVPTPDRGFVRMGDLCVGDKVFAVDGTPTRVVGVSPVWKDRPVYVVTTNDGFVVVADEAHEWDVVVDRKRPKWKTVETRYVHHKTCMTQESRALRIPLQGCVQYPERGLTVHPYVLGVWLGDGRTDSSAMCTADDFIFDKVNALEGSGFTEYARKGATRHWRPGVAGVRGSSGSLSTRLHSLGVRGDKHIPEAYMQASYEQRLDLLQGLMDTDGSVHTNGMATFFNTNERLARQVQELVQSMGVKASLCSGPAMLKGVQYGVCWKVHFYMAQCASLPRKAVRARNAVRTVGRYIRAKPAGVADTVCIEVAHESHLFLCTRGYIPTHNSESIAYLFVAWYLGHHPDHHIMMVTHTAALSADFGRKVRNLIDTEAYHEIFPGTQVSTDKAAADSWTTTVGGKYLAIGIGANVAGHGAHLLVADDTVSEQAVLFNSDTAFEHAWRYMQVGPMQRLMPGGRIVMIGCMTAETRVLMADGAEKEIQHVKVGDVVATYDAGRITTSRITNWIEHHPDSVYKIRTTSGKIVRANKRHPFLVDRDGVRTWVRVRDLRVGDCLVEVVPPSDVSDPTKPGGCVAPATSANYAQTDAQAPSVVTDTGVSGAALSVLPTGALDQLYQKGSAALVTTPLNGAQASADSQKRKNARATLSIVTAFLRRITTACSRLKGVFALSASSHQPKRTRGPEENQSCTSTTVTIPVASVGCCATIVTWPLGTPELRNDYSQPPATYATTPSAIVEIIEDGFEPVFDMEVERTENFIANGVVSHNTRWGKKDPIGCALNWAQENPESTPWLEVRFPAILPSGKSLWPQQWSVEALLAKKAGMLPQYWAAQYMQEPTSEEGAILKREWWKVWPKEDPPECEFVIQVWDTAHDTKSSNDYSACITFGVFFNEEQNRHNVIMLNAVRSRWEFPQLKAKALEFFRDWEPECLLIEKKAAGAPLIQELRQMDMIVEEVSPSRGAAGVSNDKRARGNAIAPMLFEGIVWYPDRRWAHEVLDECAEYPNGEHDDYYDCVTMGLARFRRGGFVVLDSDRKEDKLFRPRRAAYY